MQTEIITLLMMQKKGYHLLKFFNSAIIFPKFDLMKALPVAKKHETYFHHG